MMKITILVCACCQKEFTITRSDAKFCSGACKQKAYNLRVRQALLKYGKYCSLQEMQHQDKIHSLELQVDRILKERIIEPTPSPSVAAEHFEEFFAKLNLESQHRKVKDANERLRDCLIKIICDAEKDKISCSLLKINLKSIERKLGTNYSSWPENYKYSRFINERLLPSISDLIQELARETERFISFGFPEELETKIKEILKEIS